jgi:sarcosine oxidase subunit beta
MSRNAQNDHLTRLEQTSIHVFREAFANFRSVCMPWSMGKDSNVLIWLARKAFCGKIPFPLLHIDTTYEFPEMYEFREKAKVIHGIDLIVRVNEDAIRRGIGYATHDPVTVTHELKTVPFKAAIDEFKWDALVTGIRRDANGAVEGVETTRGYIAFKRVGVSAAGNTSVIMQMAGLDFPLESYPLQALVSEPVKPTFPCVVMSNTVHAYMSQSDKGELVIGAGTDQYVSYSQRGALHIVEHTLAAICEIFPIYRRMRMLRTWGGIVDVTPDRSPVLGKTPVKGLYVNCGWGTGGFKATPGAGDLLAYTMAKDEPHPINAPFNLDRFRNGRLIDEAAAAAVAH